MPRLSSPKEAHTRIQELLAEGGGLAEVHVLEREDIDDLLAAAVAGDVKARTIAVSAVDAVRTIAQSPAHDPTRCGCCERSIRRKLVTLVTVVPHTDNPGQAVTFGVCDKCSGTSAKFEAAVEAALQRMMPGFRRVTTTHDDGGRA